MSTRVLNSYYVKFIVRIRKIRDKLQSNTRVYVYRLCRCVLQFKTEKNKEEKAKQE